MFKVGDIAVYIGESYEEAGIKKGDTVRIFSLTHSECDTMADVGLKLPIDHNACRCDQCGNKLNKCREWPVIVRFLRKPSDVEIMSHEIKEALQAPIPVKKFVIKSEQ